MGVSRSVRGCRPGRAFLIAALGCLVGLSSTWCLLLAVRLPSSPLGSWRGGDDGGGGGADPIPDAFHSPPCPPPQRSERDGEASVDGAVLRPPPHEPIGGYVLFGIMTAAKYVDTRAYNVWKTWAQHVPGKVMFFVAENTTTIHADLPIVRLKGVDDTYPPQKKSFAMVKWMADNHLHDFSWFMRADDDLYIRGRELEKFLRSLDPSRPHMIGQAGLGNTMEYGTLSLGNQDNYCMGGPGVVFSRETIRLVSPHLEGCLQHLMSGHEDVELGRCVRQHVGVPCTWNYEMQKLFHNNQSEYMSVVSDDVKTSITLHPIKRPEIMRKVHAHVRSTRLREARGRKSALISELSAAAPSSLVRRVPNTLADMPVFSFIDPTKIIFCGDGVNCPRHTVEARTRTEIYRIITQLFDDFNANARQRGRVLQFQNLQYAYLRVDPKHGVDYILDMILWFKKFRAPHRTTLSVRRHAYVQQSFGPVTAIADEEWRNTLYGPMSNASDHINLILPLKGRAAIFRRFATHLRNVCVHKGNMRLSVVLYGSEDVDDNRATLADLATWMDVNVVEMGDEPFSRGIALTKGSAHLPDSALLFFTDVDMLFTCDALERIRMNTIYRSQVFFPIVFSEFSPESWSENDRLLADAFHYGRRRGYFRHFGYGLAALYKGDWKSIGGFNTDIKGWGMEDVDMFEKAIQHPTLRVMRAPEPGLVHIYHPIVCDPTMPEAQLKMCHGSKAASLASIDTLADQIIQIRDGSI